MPKRQNANNSIVFFIGKTFLRGGFYEIKGKNHCDYRCRVRPCGRRNALRNARQKLRRLVGNGICKRKDKRERFRVRKRNVGRNGFGNGVRKRKRLGGAYSQRRNGYLYEESRLRSVRRGIRRKSRSRFLGKNGGREVSCKCRYL